MATPIFDQRPAYYIGQFYRGTRIVQNVQLAGFPAGAVLKVTLFAIADMAGGISETPLDSATVSTTTVDATHRQVVIEAASSAKLTNTFGYFAEYTVDSVIVGIAKFNFGRFIPSDSTAQTGDDTIVLSAGTGSILALTNPSAPVDYVLTTQQVADAYNQIPVQHNLNSLYCEVRAWTADGRAVEVYVVPWIGDTATKPPANWSEVQLRPTSDPADKATRIMITSPSPLL